MSTSMDYASSSMAGEFIKPEEVVGHFDLKEGMKIADFGSGSGHFALEIAKRIGESGQVLAVDVVSSAVDALRAKITAEGLKNIQVSRGNLETVGGSGLLGGSQDLVLLINVLFQSQKKKDIIEEAKRVLKSGGILIEIGWKKGVKGFGPPDELRLSVDEMKGLISETGLQFMEYFEAGAFNYGLKFKK